VVKRLLDILGAVVGLLLSLPLVALAALAIKLDSPGPVFFYQVRIGENGRPFRIVKLRTMVADAEKRLDSLVKIDELKEPVFKIRNDPRVTRGGGWLRSSSIDELPQFFNVLVGEMSLVGPRPEEARIVALYNDYQRKRLAVKPGLTGPMQVAGRGELSLNERLRLELDYIDHYSLLRDIQILWQTVPAIMRKRGAF
jgi:lipopolysaccharide/colanic/teichoic acid biosynthesis glycosyltransferase